MYRVTALLYPQALATSITLPLEILQAAAQTARAGNRQAPGVTLQLAAATLAPVTVSGGITLSPDIVFADLAPPDLLIIPAIWRNPAPVVRAAQPWLPRLVSLAKADTRLCAVGTGACLLAESGLLDGRPATTHWNYMARFRHLYPAVKLKARHLITQSDNLYCVGSVNSIADLMVHLVTLWYGPGVGQAVENQFSPEIRRRFQDAAYEERPTGSHHDETVLEAQQWLRDHLQERVSLEQLAQRLGLSGRSLGRRFQQALGMSPRDWLQHQRIDQARDLLRQSNLSVGEVAWRVGMADASHFSRQFQRLVGMSPARYRNAVRGKLFTPGLP